MDQNELKKALYKENPKADFLVADEEGLWYETSLMSKGGQVIYFKIPFPDIKGAKFYQTMDAKLLIRWLPTNELS